MTEMVALTVPSHPKYLYIVRNVVHPLAMNSGFSKKEASKIVLAVDEACSNIIKYAYAGDATKTISIAMTDEGDQMVIRLTDLGKKVDAATIAPRDLDAVRPGGLGTHFMRAVFDTVAYDTGQEQGTVLTMIKKKKTTGPNAEHAVGSS
jgi:anti-sigma regulatory factor (Ser/Thr protein kinase)